MTEIRITKTKSEILYKLEVYYLLFAICSVVGWISEVLCFRLADGIWVDRGFFIGPFVPIYGIGAFATLALARYLKKNPIFLFIASALACSFLEFTTATIAEQFFGIKLWDYTDNMMNLDGKVALLTTVVFAASGLVFVYVIEPAYKRFVTRKLSRSTLEILCLICIAVFILSFIVTCRARFLL